MKNITFYVDVEKIHSISPPEQRATALDVTGRVLRQIHESTHYVRYVIHDQSAENSKVEPAKRAEWREGDAVGGTTETVQFFVEINESYMYTCSNTVFKTTFPLRNVGHKMEIGVCDRRY